MDVKPKAMWLHDFVRYSQLQLPALATAKRDQPFTNIIWALACWEHVPPKPWLQEFCRWGVTLLCGQGGVCMQVCCAVLTQPVTAQLDDPVHDTGSCCQHVSNTCCLQMRDPPAGQHANAQPCDPGCFVGRTAPQPPSGVQLVHAGTISQTRNGSNSRCCWCRCWRRRRRRCSQYNQQQQQQHKDRQSCELDVPCCVLYVGTATAASRAHKDPTCSITPAAAAAAQAAG